MASSMLTFTLTFVLTSGRSKSDPKGPGPGDTKDAKVPLLYSFTISCLCCLQHAVCCNAVML